MAEAQPDPMDSGVADAALTWDAFASWLTSSGAIEGASAVTSVEPLSVGFSNENYVVRVALDDGDGGERRPTFVVRTPPPPPGLLEPYDLEVQFRTMSALADSGVPVPGMICYEPSADILGRPFLLMDFVAGSNFELDEPEWVSAGNDGLFRGMASAAIRTLAGIHAADPSSLGDVESSSASVAPRREVDRWVEIMRAADPRTLSAFERIVDWLTDNAPSPMGRPSIMHGDFKLGNLMWRPDSQAPQVVGVMDWEMGGVGDPRADLAYYLTVTYDVMADCALAKGLDRDEAIALYEASSEQDVGDLRWFEVLAAFKLAVIYRIMYARFAQRATDDLRFFVIGRGTPEMLGLAQARAGLADAPADRADYEPERKRVAEACAAALRDMVIPAIDGDAARMQGSLLLPAVDFLAGQSTASSVGPLSERN